MPYIIAFVIVIIAAGALLLFNQPVEAPVAETQEARTEETTTNPNVPEGFTSPTEPPPSTNAQDNEGDPGIDAEENTDSAKTPDAAPEAVAVPSETYVAQASYFTPKRTEHELEVTFELEGDTVVGVNTDYDGAAPNTPNHSSFDEAYKAEVLGQNINNVELSRVGGASLTSGAFNEAVAEVRAQL